MDWKFGSRPICKASFYFRISGAWPCRSLAADLFRWTQVFNHLLSCWKQSFCCFQQKEIFPLFCSHKLGLQYWIQSNKYIWQCLLRLRTTVWTSISSCLSTWMDTSMNWVRSCALCSGTGPTSHCTAVLGAQARYFVLLKLFSQTLRAETQFVSSSDDFSWW